MSHKYRRSRPKVFCKTDVYKSFKVRKKAPVPKFCFENTARCRLFKNRLQCRCFPVSFAKFLGTTILKNFGEWLLTALFTKINYLPQRDKKR